MPLAPGATCVAGGGRASAPLPEHQQPPQTRGFGLSGGLSARSPRPSGPDCPPACPGGRGKAVRCLPDLTRPLCGAPAPRAGSALPASPRRSRWTSDVEAQAARGDPADRGAWPQPVRQAVLEALPCLGGRQLSEVTPTLFVNLVNCKSNTTVFFILLVGWVLPGPVQLTAPDTAWPSDPRSHPQGGWCGFTPPPVPLDQAGAGGGAEATVPTATS